MKTKSERQNANEWEETIRRSLVEKKRRTRWTFVRGQEDKGTNQERKESGVVDSRDLPKDEETKKNPQTFCGLKPFAGTNWRQIPNFTLWFASFVA